jgi:choline dehydrogenase-like flavoprotein
MNSTDYDVIVIGAGAGGGIAAALLCEAGHRVLLLERGQYLTFEQVGRDHIRNQRISLYGHNAGPDIDGNPRVFVPDPKNPSRSVTVRPHEGGYNNNAATVGGGTRVYGAQAWRFMEQDFRMASTYGVPEGSSLADWPISYSDLEPFYERAEVEIGVCGDADENRYKAPRRRGYPMPPVPRTLSGKALAAGAETLGWNTFTTPMLINSVPYAGRDACIQCQHCVGFACPSDAKNGTHNTMIPRAMATGLCDLKTGVMCEKIDTDSQGRVIGVSYLMESSGSMNRNTASSRAVVVSAGAIESARLMLNSTSQAHVNGLGNEFDLVGRNLQGHVYPGSQGLFENNMWDGIGPGVSISTSQFNHGNAGIVGGGMLSDEFIKLPIIFWYRSIPPDVPRWGMQAKEWMRRAYTRTLQVMGPIQDTPNPECRVTIDQSVKDRFDLPVARLSGHTHPESLKTAAFMWERSREWLLASGATRVWGDRPGPGISGGQHQAGTCRMGKDPLTSVTDSFGRVHSHDNLFVMDASVHVTNGGFNPVLTIMALTFRNAAKLAADLR